MTIWTDDNLAYLTLGLSQEISESSRCQCGRTLRSSGDIHRRHIFKTPLQIWKAQLIDHSNTELFLGWDITLGIIRWRGFGRVQREELYDSIFHKQGYISNWLLSWCIMIMTKISYICVHRTECWMEPHKRDKPWVPLIPCASLNNFAKRRLFFLLY